MTYEEEKKLYNKIMDSISRAFIYGDNLDDSHTWSSLHDDMIQPFLNTRIQVVRKLQSKEMVKISSQVFTETDNFIKNHIN